MNIYTDSLSLNYLVNQNQWLNSNNALNSNIGGIPPSNGASSNFLSNTSMIDAQLMRYREQNSLGAYENSFNTYFASLNEVISAGDIKGIQSVWSTILSNKDEQTTSYGSWADPMETQFQALTSALNSEDLKAAQNAWETIRDTMQSQRKGISFFNMGTTQSSNQNISDWITLSILNTMTPFPQMD